jgi:hypothetical protein
MIGHADADRAPLGVLQRRGVSRVAGSRNVNGPGVAAFSSRNCQVSTRA